MPRRRFDHCHDQLPKLFTQLYADPAYLSIILSRKEANVEYTRIQQLVEYD